jgi:hypothetical protein
MKKIIRKEYKSILVDKDVHYKLKELSLKTGKPILELIKEFVNK